MLEEFFTSYYFSIVFSGVVIIPFFIGLYNFKYLEFPEQIIFLFIMVSLASDVLMHSMAFLFNNNLIIIYNYVLIETFLLFCFYASLINATWFRRTLTITYLLFLFAYIIDATMNNFRFITNYYNTIESILVLICAFFLFYYVMRNDITDNLMAQPFFWINCGIIFYVGGAIFVFTLNKFLPVQRQILMWNFIHNSLILIFYFSISIGFWKARKQISSL